MSWWLLPLPGGSWYRAEGECGGCGKHITLDVTNIDQDEEYACPNCGKRYVINIVHQLQLLPVEDVPGHQ